MCLKTSPEVGEAMQSGEAEPKFVEVGRHLKRRRKERYLTLRDVSELTGLSAGHISRIERDVAVPSLPVLGRLCAALDLNPADLFAGLPEGREPAPLVSAERHQPAADYPDLNLELLPRNALSLTAPEATAAVMVRVEQGQAKVSSNQGERILLAGEGMIILNTGALHVAHHTGTAQACLRIGFFAGTRFDVIGMTPPDAT